MNEIPYPLRTKRLILRRFMVEDLDAYYEYQRLPETAQYLYGGPRTYVECMARIAKYVQDPFSGPGDWATFAVECKATPGLVGELALKWNHGGKPESADSGPEHDSDSGPERVGPERVGPEHHDPDSGPERVGPEHHDPERVGEIGWTLAPKVQGQGLATEAARAVLQLAIDTLGFHRVEARLDARNSSSAAICERLGMKREGVLKENMYLKGEWTSEAIYAVVRSSSQARQ